MRIRILGTCTPVKSAKLTVRDADVGMVKMAVDVVVGRSAVLLSANMVGQFAYRVQVVRRIQRHPVVKRQPLAVLDLVGDVSQVLDQMKTA